MKRGGIRTHRKYIEEDGERKIKFEIQGRKGQAWFPVVETDQETKQKIPMVYDNLKEAEAKLKEIVKQVRGRK